MSENMKFTDSRIRAFRPRTNRYEIWETGRKGFGLRVAPTGRKSWIFLYRFHGKARRMTLGVYPRINLAQAHEVHGRAEARLNDGFDPGAELVEAKNAERNAETVLDLWGEYYKRHALPKKKSAAADKRLFEKDIGPLWGKKKAKDIIRRDAIKLLDGIVDRGSPVMANRCLALLTRVWKFGLQRDILDTTPFFALEKPSKETPRKRVLTDNEIILFWNGIEALGMSKNMQFALKLMLATGTRRAEAVEAPLSEFDLNKKEWVIAATRRKNTRPDIDPSDLLVPLSDLAVALIGEIQEHNAARLAESNAQREAKGRPPIEPSRFLFPNEHTGQALTPLSISHALRNRFGKFDGLELKKSLGIHDFERFTAHDLRRSCFSGMQRLKIPTATAHKVLGHIEGNKMTRTYGVYEFEDEKAEALQRWGRHIAGLLSGQEEAGKVVNLADRR